MSKNINTKNTKSHIAYIISFLLLVASIIFFVVSVKPGMLNNITTKNISDLLKNNTKILVAASLVIIFSISTFIIQIIATALAYLNGSIAAGILYTVGFFIGGISAFIGAIIALVQAKHYNRSIQA